MRCLPRSKFTISPTSRHDPLYITRQYTLHRNITVRTVVSSPRRTLTARMVHTGYQEEEEEWRQNTWHTGSWVSFVITSFDLFSKVFVSVQNFFK